MPIITEKIALQSGFTKENINVLKHIVVDKYIPKNKSLDDNNNPCFMMIPKIEVSDYNLYQCKSWVAKNGKNKQKIILATTLESALYKLNAWSLKNDCIEWSLLKMTRFSENKNIGIFESPDVKTNLIM